MEKAAVTSVLYNRQKCMKYTLKQTPLNLQGYESCFHEVLELLNVLMLIKINLIHFSVHLILNAVKLPV